MPTSVVFLRAVIAVVERLGVSTEAALRESGIHPDVFCDVSNMVDEQNAERLVRALIARSPRQPLSLAVGEACSEASFHLFGQTWAACPTLREALQQATDLAPQVLGWGSIRVEETETTARIVLNDSVLSLLAGFTAEVYLCILCKIALRFAGEASGRVRSMEFPRSWTPRGRACVCGVSSSYGHGEAALVVDRDLLDDPMPGADSKLVTLLRQLTLREMTAPRVETSWSNRVRRQLQQETELTHVDFGRMAVAFGLSLRTLRRRIRYEHLSLTTILDETRIDRATALLESGGLSIKEIADVLGYSEVSSFHRAFKRCSGETPREFRSRASVRPRSLQQAGNGHVLSFMESGSLRDKDDVGVL